MTKHLTHSSFGQNKQRGITFVGMLFVGGLLVFAALLVMNIAPAYGEFMSIKKILRVMDQDESLTGLNDKKVREAFDKRASIDYVTAVKGSDLTIEKGEGGKPVISVEYQVVKPIVANVSVLLDFSASSSDN